MPVSLNSQNFIRVQSFLCGNANKVGNFIVKNVVTTLLYIVQVEIEMNQTLTLTCVNFLFYDNYRNSCTQIFIVNKRTDTCIYNLCDASTNESGQHCRSSLRIHRYFYNVMTKFMINNRTDA